MTSAPRRRRVALGCGALVALPVLTCVLGFAWHVLRPGSVDWDSSAARGFGGGSALLDEMRARCPIEARHFDDARVVPEVTRLWLTPSGARDQYAAKARVRVFVRGEAGGARYYTVEAHAALAYTAAPPADRRYIVPVPGAPSWIPSDLRVDSCTERPAPAGIVAALWDAYRGY